MRDKRFTKLWVVAATTVSFAAGQTQVDLRTQSKSVDFSSAPSTKPFQTGASLPATCTVGQMFFVTSAPGGQNSFGCVAANTWVAQSAGTPEITISNSGSRVGAEPAVDFSSGPGVLYATSDTGSKILVQTSLDTSVVQTSGRQQTGSALSCVSSSGSTTTYTCAMSPTLTVYTQGMVMDWQPDLSGAGGPTTINIDVLGAKSVTEADGLTNPSSSDILEGRMYQIWYDGTVFRLLGNGGAVGPVGAQGPAGPTGPTGPAGPAGFGAFSTLLGGTSAVSQNGTDVSIYSTTLPALAAGSCYRISFSENDTSSPSVPVVLKVFVDSTLIATPFSSAFPSPYLQQLLYCNNPGVQNAQGLAYLSPLFYGNGSVIYSNVDSTYHSPGAIDWSMSHTIFLKTNMASGTVTGNFFAIY